MWQLINSKFIIFLLKERESLIKWDPVASCESSAKKDAKFHLATEEDLSN